MENLTAHRARELAEAVIIPALTLVPGYKPVWRRPLPDCPPPIDRPGWTGYKPGPPYVQLLSFGRFDLGNGPARPVAPMTKTEEPDAWTRRGHVPKSHLSPITWEAREPSPKRRVARTVTPEGREESRIRYQLITLGKSTVPLAGVRTPCRRDGGKLRTKRPYGSAYTVRKTERTPDWHELAAGYVTVKGREINFPEDECDAPYPERDHVEPLSVVDDDPKKVARAHAKALGHGRQVRPEKLGSYRSKGVPSVEATDVFFGDPELDKTLCWLLDKWENKHGHATNLTRKDLGNAVAMLYLETPNPCPEQHREKSWLRRLFKANHKKIAFADSIPFKHSEWDLRRQRVAVAVRQKHQGLTPDEVDALEQIAAWAKRDPETAERLIEEFDREHGRKLTRERVRRHRHPGRYRGEPIWTEADKAWKKKK